MEIDHPSMVMSVRRGALTVLVTSVVLVILTSGTLVPASAEPKRPLVVCTTTVLGSVVEDLAGDYVDVYVIASPSVCPAHYDIRPSDVEIFGRADLILMHGFEPWIKDLKEASGSKAAVIRVKGSWSTLEDLKSLYERVAGVIEKELGVDLSLRLSRCLKSIDETGSWLKNYSRSNGFVGKPVVCMIWQKPFVRYMGFRVVGTFRPPEMVSAKEYREVVKNATKENALLVIDNLQSGTDLGVRMADEVGAVEVAMTNFPGTAPGLNNMTQVMKYNSKLLARGLQRASYVKSTLKLRHEVEIWRSVALISLAIAVMLLIALLIRRR